MPEPIEQLFNARLKSQGASLTKVRLQIFKLLLDQPPQSMSTLHARGHSRFDRASLYRTIKLFEALGIVNRVPDGWKYRLELSDLFSVHHHHLSCLNCGLIIDIDDDKALEAQISQLAGRYQLVPTRHQLEIQGYCQKCLKAKPRAALDLN